MNKPTESIEGHITCSRCGKTDVPDWDGKGHCITCARDEVLGSESIEVDELDEILDTYQMHKQSPSVRRKCKEALEALYNQRMELNQAETRLSEAAWWYKNHTNKVYKKLGMLKQRYERMQERYDFLRTRAGINKKEEV